MKKNRNNRLKVKLKPRRTKNPAQALDGGQGSREGTTRITISLRGQAAQDFAMRLVSMSEAKSTTDGKPHE